MIVEQMNYLHQEDYEEWGMDWLMRKFSKSLQSENKPFLEKITTCLFD